MFGPQRHNTMFVSYLTHLIRPVPVEINGLKNTAYLYVKKVRENIFRKNVLSLFF